MDLKLGMVRGAWGRVLPGYAAVGFGLGVLNLALTPLGRSFGFPRDTGVGVNVLVLMPSLLVIGASIYPSVWISLAGMLSASLGWSAGYALSCVWSGLGDVGMIGYGLAIMGRILLPVYLVVSLLATLMVRAWRR